MSDFLQQMASMSAARAALLAAPGAGALDRPLLALAADAFDLIAEIKGRSPAEGELSDKAFDRAAQASRYAAGGAAAISVLTEPSRFDGSMQHLEDVVAAVPDTPVMRKDFLVDIVQVLEARAAGASGVLLIVAMLDDRRLRAMLDCAAEHRMFVLLESFDSEDLTRTRKLLTGADDERIESGQLLFGVNTRNLRTLAVDPDRLKNLAAELPRGRSVAESGLYTARDAATVARLGYSLALVGTALMKSDDPAGLVAAMKEAGSVGLAA